jgi:hypothetical protein
MAMKDKGWWLEWVDVELREALSCFPESEFRSLGIIMVNPFLQQPTS